MGAVALPAFGPWSECGVPLTGCDGPIFNVDGTFDLEATLSWDLPTNDLDLFLARWVAPRTWEEISRDGDNDATEPVTTQVLRYDDLPPGDYRLWVAPQHGVEIECELDVVFR